MSILIITHNHLSFLAGLKFDTPVAYQTVSEYWHPNVSDGDMEAAWDAIDTNAIAISLHDNYAKAVGLAPSTRFPWDTERSVYYVKGIHDLHCLVCSLCTITEHVTDCIRQETHPQSHRLKTSRQESSL